MSLFLDDGDVRLFNGDALEQLQALPDGCVDMVATSPPFYGLRDYGTGKWEGGDAGCDHKPRAASRSERPAGGLTGGKATVDAATIHAGACHCGARRVDCQIGLEQTPQEWVDNLVAVFRECRRVLADHGTLWVEIGDSYCSGEIGRHDTIDPNSIIGQASQKWSDHQRQTSGRKHPTKQKDLLGQPWLLAKALRDPYYTGTIKAEADRVWLAAMIDAEGCISIHKRPAGTPNYAPYTRKDGTTANYERKNDSFQPKVEISNTSQAIMDRVVAIAGGNCDTKQEAGTQGRKQTLYRWTLTADKCRDLLREVYPHLVGKQHEARLAIGCPSSGEKAAAAHEALKLLHGGSTTGIDFPAPESMWEAGWYLRSEIIWSRLRPNPMPESVTDRPTKAHSTVFLLSKQPRYFYDADAIREAVSPNWTNGGGSTVAEWGDHIKTEGRSKQHRLQYDTPMGANARSVWTIPTEPTPFAHFATWPQKLVARMIQAGTSERGKCPECGKPWVRETEIVKGSEPRTTPSFANHHGAGRDGRDGSRKWIESVATIGWSPSCACNSPKAGRGNGSEDLAMQPVAAKDRDKGCHPCVVLDPFAGSGTTLLVARNHQRHAIGIELNPDYCKLATQRLQQLSLLT